MAVTFETAGTSTSWVGGTTTSGTKTVSVNTDPSRTDRTAVLAFEWTGTGSVASVPFTATYGGVAMVLQDTQQFWDTNKSTTAMFILENAPGGPKDFVLSFSGAPNTGLVSKSLLITAGTWVGVDSVGTATTHAGGTTTTANAITVTSVLPAHKVITVHAVGAGLSSGAYSQTLRAKSDLFNGGALFMGDAPGAATVTATATQGSTSKWYAFGLSLAPAVVDFASTLQVDLALSASSGTYRAADPSPDRTWYVDGGFVDLRAQDTRVGARARGVVGAHLNGDGLVVFDFEDGLESEPLDLAGPPGQVNDAAVHYLVWTGNITTGVGTWPARPADTLPVLWIGGVAPGSAPAQQRAGDVWIPTIGDERPFGPVLEAMQLAATTAQTILYFVTDGVLGNLGLSKDGTLAANSDTNLVSQKAIKTYVDAVLVAAKAYSDAALTTVNNTLTTAVTVVSENPQTGTTYTLVAGDNTKIVSMNNSAANTLTIPKDTLPVGFTCQVISIGTGLTTLVKGDVSITTRSSGGKMKLTGQNSSLSIYCRAANDFIIVGDLSA